MAELIFKDLANKKGVADRFVVRSSATSDEEIYRGVGNPVYPPAKTELAKHGIESDGKRAVRLCAADADKYDLFIGMDANNIECMHRILGEKSADKIYKLMSFAGSDDDVADPWYSRRFDIAYEDIRKGCKALLDSLLN